MILVTLLSMSAITGGAFLTGCGIVLIIVGITGLVSLLRKRG